MPRPRNVRVVLTCWYLQLIVYVDLAGQSKNPCRKHHPLKILDNAYSFLCEAYHAYLSTPVSGSHQLMEVRDLMGTEVSTCPSWMRLVGLDIAAGRA